MRKNYPQNRKGRVPKPEKEDPWKGVRVVRGKLVGGILTDSMALAIWPAGHIKLSNTGLTVVAIKSVSGGKTPSRPR